MCDVYDSATWFVKEGVRLSDKVYTAVKDSGARQEFATGSVRDTPKGKGRYDLISPIALKRLAVHYENGAAKYSENNWMLGQPLNRYIESAIRHLYTYLAGDDSEDHMAAAAWNVFSFMHTKDWIDQGILPAELDNTGIREKYAKAKTTG
jgi:hypothetical protein